MGRAAIWPALPQQEGREHTLSLCRPRPGPPADDAFRLDAAARNVHDRDELCLSAHFFGNRRRALAFPIQYENSMFSRIAGAAPEQAFQTAIHPRTPQLQCPYNRLRWHVPNREESLVVLVVEDEWLVRAAIAANLRECGCRVLEAPDGETALSLVKGGALVHAVVTDINLAGRMDGWDVGEALRALLPGVAVIYASGAYTEPRRPVRGGREIDKPYSHTEVLEACRSMCDGALASEPCPTRSVEGESHRGSRYPRSKS